MAKKERSWQFSKTRPPPPFIPVDLAISPLIPRPPDLPRRRADPGGRFVFAPPRSSIDTAAMKPDTHQRPTAHGIGSDDMTPTPAVQTPGPQRPPAMNSSAHQTSAAIQGMGSEERMPSLAVAAGTTSLHACQLPSFISHASRLRLQFRTTSRWRLQFRHASPRSTGRPPSSVSLNYCYLPDELLCARFHQKVILCKM
jgi:hypothetical protein